MAGLRHPRVDTRLALVPVVMALGVWGQRWTRRALAPNEMDLGLLLWALERGAHPEALGPERTVIELELTDQKPNKRRWWFLNEEGRCELCLKQPDRDVQLFVSVSLPDLIRVWRGDLTVTAAISSGRLRLHGSAAARKAFRQWLGISTLAHVRPAAGARMRGGSAEPMRETQSFAS